MIDVLSVRTKIFTKDMILQTDIQRVLTRFIDSALFKEEKWKIFHQEQYYKLYSFDSLFPIEKSKQYQPHHVYTLTIRTTNHDLAKYFVQALPYMETEKLKGLVSEIQILPYRPIEKLYSITPVIIKHQDGYWKTHMTLADYEKQLFENLIKKYNQATGQKIDEDFEWFRMITFFNQKPISVKQKNIHLLGDKIEIYVADNPWSQELSHFALGVGIGSNNSRGAGFCNVKWV